MEYRNVKAAIGGKITVKRYGGNRVRVGKPLKYDAMTDSFTKSVAQAVAHKRANNLPVAKYDEKTKRAYLEYPDGRREYFDEA